MNNLERDKETEYRPADIALFRERGFGLLQNAENALGALEVQLKFLSGYLSESKTNPSIIQYRNPGAFSALAALAKAEDSVYRLQYMSKENYTTHVKLDGGTDRLPEFKQRLAKALGTFDALQEAHINDLHRVLPVEINFELDHWATMLAWAEKDSRRPYVEEGDEQDESIGDFCTVRGRLELFAQAVSYRNLDVDMLRLMDGGTRKTGYRHIPIDLENYKKRVNALDPRFRKVLRGRSAEHPAFWTDESFWWDHLGEKKGP